MGRRHQTSASKCLTSLLASSTLLLGYELSLSPDLANRLIAGEPSTFGASNAILVDVPFVGWPLHAEESLFKLQLAGFRPILAHPERYEEIQRNPERALDLVDRGVLLQVTIGSLSGMFGKQSLATAELLVREGAVHVVASDAHSAGQRFTAVEAGLAHLRGLVSEGGLERLTTINPRATLSNAPVESVSPNELRLGLQDIEESLGDSRRRNDDLES